MKHVAFFLTLAILCTLLFSCSQMGNGDKGGSSQNADTAKYKMEIASMLDSFNLAASAANYDLYFNFFTANAVFIGTDATEHWDKPAFMVWARPYFNKHKTWHFTAIDRHIYFNNHPDIAWFDELLSTQMKICRGSGVVIKTNNQWKLEQYVLSATIPNILMDSITKMKAPIEDSLMKKINGKQ